MNEIFKLFGTIAIDGVSEAEKEIKGLSDTAEKSSSKIGSVFKGIGKIGATVGKVVGGAMLAAGTAVAGLVTKSTQSYAEYEQLVGGVDTLFKNSSAKVQKYAENAYKTAGLSANEYMNTVTSFSASLLQSLGGDTEAAADKADMAITDMSDNANKMGTSMESIQNAYQGFAKQNYTMLDNLKLGYGGTKEEMQRLLEDAKAISGIDYDISSYADVVDAIHVIQAEMGITGTTSKEAAGTITGSMSAVKGAWANLMTAMASDNLPIDEYINKFVDSASAMVSNMLPRIQQALVGVVQLINQLAPIIIGKIPELFSQLLPSIIQAATGLVSAVVTILPDLIQALLEMIPAFIDGVVQIINAIIEALPTVMQTLVAALPTLIPVLINGLVSMIVTLCDNLIPILQPLLDALPDIIITIVEVLLSNLPILIEAVISLVLGIVEALPQIITSLIDAIPTIVEMLVTALLENLPALIMGCVQLVIGLVTALPQILSSLWNALKTLCHTAVSGLFNQIGEWIRTLFPKSADNIFKVLNTIRDAFKTLIDNLKAIFSVVVSVISVPFKLAWNGIKLVWDNVVAFFKMIWNNIKAVFSVVDSVLSGDFKGAWDGIKQIWSNVVGFFKNIISNIKNAFSKVGEILSSPFRKAKDAIKKIVDNIKGFFSGLKLRFPKIKLPHFKIKPSGWKIGDLLEGSIPKLAIDWYAKGGVIDSPSVIGVGEDGAEAVVPLERNTGWINKVADEVAEQINVSNSDSSILDKLDELIRRIEALKIWLNGEVLVGELVGDIDSKLGQISKLKGRAN